MNFCSQKEAVESRTGACQRVPGELDCNAAPVDKSLPPQSSASEFAAVKVEEENEVKEEPVDVFEVPHDFEFHCDQVVKNSPRRFHGDHLQGNSRCQKVETQITEGTPCGQYVCSTNHRGSLKQHTTLHSSVKALTCKHCPFRAKNKAQFKSHLQLHVGDGELQCGYCPFKANTLAVLNKHFQSHVGEKFACSHCPYQTLHRSNFRTHLLLHSDVRQYACDQCPFTAKQGSSLRRHKIVHSGERRFACAHCPYRTFQKWNLRLHLLTHSNERNFACDVCDYRGKCARQLTIHSQSHSNLKKYGCDKCSYKTNFKGNLTKHLNSHANPSKYGPKVIATK